MTGRNGWQTIAAALPLLVVACGGGDGGAGDGAAMPGSELSGKVEIDGSSTVYPISEAMAEEFTLSTGGGVRATVGQSGTGGGFKRFCGGETDISNASRPIKDSEKELCGSNGVGYVDFLVGLDGIAVVTNPKNDYAACITVAELKRIWEPNSTVKMWSDVRPAWPKKEIKLYGPGTNSGTFDYFTEAVMGQEDASRADYTASEDDNVLVQGVEGDEFALGYFGYAYYEENQSRLKHLAVDPGSGCVDPTTETIKTGTYKPLSRPLFIYVNKAALARPEVNAFVKFYLENAAELVPQVGYVALEGAQYQSAVTQLQQATGGSQP
jgi:phosphate transport system substrate-binding protein